MVMTDNAGRWARERAEQLEREKAQHSEKLRKLHAEIRELEDKDPLTSGVMLRAQRFNPSSGICPRCAINDNVTSELKPVTFGNVVIEGRQQGVDLMTCPRCGWDDTV